MDWITLLVAILTPVAVYGATWIVTKYAPLLSGAIIVTVVVPILTAVITTVTQWIGGSDLSPVLQAALGLLAVFLSQIQIQIKKAQTT